MKMLHSKINSKVTFDPPSDEDEEDLLGYFHPRPEIANYGGFGQDFKWRLGGVRTQVKKGKSRADDDLEGFKIFTENNSNWGMTPYGYPQWGGSSAQTALEKDMLAFKHLEMKPAGDLHDTNPVCKR